MKIEDLQMQMLPFRFRGSLLSSAVALDPSGALVHPFSRFRVLIFDGPQDLLKNGFWKS